MPPQPTTCRSRTDQISRSVAEILINHGYLCVDQSRYIQVLTEARVNRIIFDGKDGDDLIATGVEFEYNGVRHVVNAKKEVILSAGQVDFLVEC